MLRILLGTALLSSVAMVGTASADIDGCGSIKVCVWADNQYQNKIANRDENLPRYNFPDSARNRNDSWANNSNDFAACAYDGLDGTGDKDEYLPNHNDNDVAPFNSDDKESMRTRNGC